MEKLRVIVVDDELAARTNATELLRKIPDCELVGTAENGRQALELARAIHPQVVLADVSMPGMSGLELVRALKAEQPEIQVIMLTMYSDFEYARQAIELKVDQYLLKPLTRADMIKALESTRQKIEDGRAQKDYLRKYEQELKEFERFSRRTFFEKLVDGSLSVQEIYEQAEKLNLDLTADGYNFVVFAV